MIHILIPGLCLVAIAVVTAFEMRKNKRFIDALIEKRN